MDKPEFSAFLAEHAKRHWDSHKTPYLLADIPSDLREEKSIEYKTILGEQRLKSFASETSETNNYKVVQHPTQRAKVGLVPHDVQYMFPEEETRHEKSGVFPRVSDRRKTVIDFLRLISELSVEDQEKISIPVGIVSRLIADK